VRESLAVRQKPRAGESARQFRTRAEGADEDYWKTAAELSRLIIGPAAHGLALEGLPVEEVIPRPQAVAEQHTLRLGGGTADKKQDSGQGPTRNLLHGHTLSSGG